MSDDSTGDSVYFGVFNQVCELGLLKTGKTMIEESWETLESFASGNTTFAETEVEDATAGLRASLMMMLSDLDGQEFKKWQQAFRNDRNESIIR